MNTKSMIFASTAALLLASALPATAQTSWDLTNTLHIGGAGNWDYVTADPKTHRLFVTRSTHTQIIDEATGKVLGDVPGQKSSHGVAIVPAVNRGFITDGGGTGQIVIFDLTTYAVLGHLDTLPDSDGIIYDAKHKLVLAVSGDEGKLMTFPPDIDPASGKIDPPIDLGGKPEFLVADGDQAFVNLEDKDLVAQVDLTSRKVLARWPVAPGGHPVGLSIDRKDHRLFIGCRNPQKLVVMSTEDGKILASVPIGAGVDATVFFKGQAFASTRDGAITVAGGDPFAVQQTVKTPLGARTMGIDTASQKIYLPTADFEPAAAGARPRTKPNTFVLLEVGTR